MNDLDLGTIFASVELRLDGLTTGVAQSAKQITTLTNGLDALQTHAKTTGSGLDALERRLRAVAQRAGEAQAKLASIHGPERRRVATEQALDTLYQADHTPYDAERRAARRQYGQERDAGVPDATAQEAYAAKLAAIDAREEADQARHQDALQRQREAARRAEEATWQAEDQAGLVTNAQIAALLHQRLALYANSTERFAELTRQLRRIPQATLTIGAPTDAPAKPTGILPAQDLAASVDVEIAAEDKKQKFLYQSQQQSLAQYRDYLTQRLALLTPYSDAWYAVAERLRALELPETRTATRDGNPFARLASGMESAVNAAMRHWTNFRAFFQKLLADLAKLLLSTLGESIWDRVTAKQKQTPRSLAALVKPPPVTPSQTAAPAVPGTPPIAPAQSGASGTLATLSALSTFVPGGQFAQALGLFGSLKTLFHFERGGLPPVGVPSIVGEHGPELFLPSIAGRIVPNGALHLPNAPPSASTPRQSGAGARHYSVTVHQHIGTVQGVDDLERAGEDLGWMLTHRLAVAK